MGLVPLPAAGTAFSQDGEGRTMMYSDMGENYAKSSAWYYVGSLRKQPNFTKMMKTTTHLRCILKIILLESFQELCEKLLSRCSTWYHLLIPII